MIKICIMKVDLGRYHQQAESKDRVTSTKMVTNWMKTSDDLARSVEEVLSRVNIVLDTAEEESKNLDSLKLNSCSIEDEELKVRKNRQTILFDILLHYFVDDFYNLDFRVLLVKVWHYTHN